MNNYNNQNNLSLLLLQNFQNSEEFINTIFEAIPSPVFYKDVEGKYLGCNKAFAEFLGLEKEEIMGRTVYEVSPPEIAKKHNELDDELFNSPGTRTYEWILQNNKGEIKQVQIDKSTFLDSAGKITGIIGVISDITDRKKAEKELKYHLEIQRITASISSHFLELHYSEIDKGIDWALKTIGSFIGVDRGYLYLFDEKLHYMNNANEWTSKPIFSIKERLQNVPANIFPWWTNKIKNDSEVLINSINDLPLDASAEKEVLNSFGIKSELAYPVSKKEKIYGFIGFNTFNDEKNWNEHELMLIKMVAEIFANAIETHLTEMKFRETQEKYKSLVEQSLTGIYIIQDGRFKYINPRFSEIFGYSQKEIIETCKVTDLVYHKDLEKVQDNLRKRLEGEKLAMRYNFRGMKKDDTIIHVEVHGRRVEYLGKPAVMGVILDISVAKEFENSLKLAKEEAEKSNKLKSEFLAQMSHEIRTPINTLLSFANLIRSEISDSLNKDIAECFSSMDVAGDRIIRTIDLILNMSAIQTNNYELNPTKIDIYKDIVLNHLNEWCLNAKRKNLDFMVQKICKDSKVFIDIYSVTQILNNLIDNAIKFTSKGLVKVTIQRIENKLTVSVQDTGIGISEDFLQNIFEPFAQEQQGYTRQYDGNGLGLALVKEYCRMNDIILKVTSKKNIGSTFSIRFK